jgi:hypothetical protein
MKGFNLNKILGWLTCHILRSHDWTCKAQEGIKPNPPLDEGMDLIMADYHEYAKMYCKRWKCKKVYHDRI